MPALPTLRDSVQGLARRTQRSAETATAALRRALARLVNRSAHQQPDRRTS